MPGLGGRRLAEQARALAPTLRVLFTSGYTENSIVHNGRLDPGVELLSKPYDRDRLAAKLRRVLDAPTPSANEGGRAAGV
jgi:CheY-like chemotaxis protein